MPLYKIRDWDIHFENKETRKLKNLRWVPVPNKHDGLTFRRMAKHPNAERLFCAWNLILQLASKTQPPERRGYLERDGIPLSPEDAGDSTGFGGDLFKEAFEFFSSNGNSWLEVIYAESPETQGDSPCLEGTPPLEGRKEGNGREEKRREYVGNSLPQTSKISDDDWLNGLKKDKTYDGIDVEREYGKMMHWCSENRKQATRRRFINWLNRADKPLSKPPKKENDISDWLEK